MITSSLFWTILVLGVPLYWCLPSRFRMGLLAGLSLTYVASLNVTSALMMLVWALAFHRLAPGPAGGPRRWVVPGLILGLLTFLFWFKYLPPMVAAFAPKSSLARIALPMGISYFTFKLIHYAVEVRRGRIEERSLAAFLAYVFLVPIFTSGPIERYDHFLAHLEPRFQRQSLFTGLTRIGHGLVKRLVLAELILSGLGGELVPAALMKSLATTPALDLWGRFILVFLYHYLDFSALSDIAIGASRLFGIRIMENFNWPIVARNIGDFWKRWHMTLAGWCQAYVYMPLLGRTRNPYLAVYATFLTMGVWHSGSLSWVCWGLYHATGVSVALTWARLKREREWGFLDRGLAAHAGIPLTFLFVSAGSVLPTLAREYSALDAIRVLARMLGIVLSPGA